MFDDSFEAIKLPVSTLAYDDPATIINDNAEMKPRIGTYFQAKVDKYVAPTNQMADEDEEATAMKPPSLPCSQKLVEVSDSVSSKRRRRGSYNATRSDQGMFFKTAIYDIV
jgi:hypothetical protein